jgi:hypothetical protein
MKLCVRARRFFWSISPLAPAAMTEEMVRFALTSPDEAREDYPLTLNVYVCLLIGTRTSQGLSGPPNST